MITSFTAFIDRKLRMSRPLGSVWNRRVSTDSAGATRRDWIRPVFRSNRKSSRIPRIWPSSVMTVLPRSSVAKNFTPASLAYPAGLIFPFLANSWPDVGIKPSDDYSNHSSRLVTALSYTPRGLQPGACPEADLGPYRDRAQRVPRPGHVRRGGLQPRDERVPRREPRNAARPPAAPRGDRPSGGLSAADGGSQAELGLPRQREGLQEGPRGDRACGRRICGPRRLPQPHRARRRREPLPDGPRLRRRRAAADLPGPSRAAGPMARGRDGPPAADVVAAP